MVPKVGPKFGYVLPTREYAMNGRPEAAPLLDLAAKAEALGFDSVWVGDSLTARPRHEPLTLLAAIAIRAPTITLGTAVLLPVLRNPVVLAHQIATLDQISEGRLILGVGVGPDTPGVRAEHVAAGVPFERRTGAMLEGLRLCQALWSGKTVDWDGRWKVSGATLAPTPHRPGGPPLWIGGSAPRVRERAGKLFDGWVPVSPDATQWGDHWTEIREHIQTAGREAGDVTGAVCLNLSIDDDRAVADRNLDAYLAQYYGVPSGTAPRQSHGSYAGPAAGAAEWLHGFASAGVEHFVLRFAGNNDSQLEIVAALKSDLGW